MDIEFGLFFSLIGVAILFLFINVRYKHYFHIISVFLFLVLGSWFMMGSNVIMTESITDGTTTWTSTNYLIGDDTGVYNEVTPWLGLAFILGAIILGFVTFLSLTDPKEALK